MTDVEPTAAPSQNSTAAAPDDAAALRAELEAHKAKTAKWKTVVKAQLDEAAAKNERLRADLAAANKRADSASADVRLELTAEFKERTAAKDADLARLHEEVRAMRAAATQADAAHRTAMERAVADAAEQLRSALQAAQSAEAHKLEHAKALHDAELEKVKRKLDASRAELRSMTSRCEELTAQVASLKSELTAAKDPTLGAEAAAIEKRKDERHAAEIASVEQRLADRESQIKTLQARLAADAARHEQGLQGLAEKKEAQFRADIARREEQLHVASAMLTQARDEASAAFARLQRAEAESAAVVDAAQRRVATVTAELAAKVSQVSQLQHELKQLSATNAKLESQLAIAEAESASREEAFKELFDRDFNKEGIMRLEQLLTAARSENDDLRQQLADMEKEAQARLTSAESAAKEVSDAQSQLETRMRLLSTREEHLKDLERRVHDNQLRLAQHAQQLQLEQQQQQQRGGDGAGKRNLASSSGADDGGVGSLRYDPFVSNLRAGRLMLETQGSLVLQRYRRFLPWVLIALMLFPLYWFAGTTPTNSGQGALRAVAEQADSLTALRRQYDATLRSLVACEAACPAAINATASSKP